MKPATFIAAAAAAAPFAMAMKTAESGKAVVINKCNTAFPLMNVPATANSPSDPSVQNQTLAAYGQPDNTYTQNWVQLDINAGWSIKINDVDDWNNILQFEYTYATDNQIWYDASYVNGEGQGNHAAWEFECPDAPVKPHTNAYIKWNDDSKGMQLPVQPSAVVTLILCPENSAPAGGSDSSSSQAPAPSSSSYVAPPAPTSEAPSTTLQTYAQINTPDVHQAQVSTPEPTPESTPTAASEDHGDAVIATVFETKVVVATVTETASPEKKKKRHLHRHPHGPHAF